MFRIPGGNSRTGSHRDPAPADARGGPATFDLDTWRRQVRADQARWAIRLAALRAQHEATCLQIDRIWSDIDPARRPVPVRVATPTTTATDTRRLYDGAADGKFDIEAWKRALQAQQARYRNRVRAVQIQHMEIMRHIECIEAGDRAAAIAA